MLQSHSRAGLNWYEMFLGFPILGIWYWCTDRPSSSAYLAHAPSATPNSDRCSPDSSKSCRVPAGVPGRDGLRAVQRHHRHAGQSDPPGDDQPTRSHGLKGLISAAVLAALMSAVSAALNSSGRWWPSTSSNACARRSPTPCRYASPVSVPSS